MHGITDLSLREVGDMTFAFYNSKGWRGVEGGGLEVYESSRHSIVSPALLLLKELACIKKMTCLLLVSGKIYVLKKTLKNLTHCCKFHCDSE